jgi:hypothetical protein
LKKIGEAEAADDRGAGCQSCQSVDQEKAGSESCPTRESGSESRPTRESGSESCPTGMEALADDPSEPVRIKPTARTEADDRARTYAVGQQSGESVVRTAEQRGQDLRNDVGPPGPHDRVRPTSLLRPGAARNRRNGAE